MNRTNDPRLVYNCPDCTHNSGGVSLASLETREPEEIVWLQRPCLGLIEAMTINARCWLWVFLALVIMAVGIVIRAILPVSPC